MLGEVESANILIKRPSSDDASPSNSNKKYDETFILETQLSKRSFRTAQQCVLHEFSAVAAQDSLHKLSSLRSSWL